MVVIPLLLLAGAEIVLRCVGYGWSASLFIKENTLQGPVWSDNPHFTRLFFPAGMARNPEHFSFPVVKPADCIRVFVFGESAAQGDPEPAFGFARLMEVMLKAEHPGQKIEVINLGITAINSHVIRKIAHDAQDKQADYWVIYMGNNEVIGPFGAAGVLTPDTPSTSRVRLVIALKSTRLGQWMANVIQQFQGKSRRSRLWEGMETFSAQRIAADDPRRIQVRRNFQENLRAIVESGENSGSRVLLCTIAVNQKDCAPFASVNKKSLDANQLQQWNRHFQAGISNENAGHLPLAMAQYTQALAMDATHAETHYRLARCHRAAREVEAAQEHYRLAVDYDALQFRADSGINRTIREMVQESRIHSSQVQLVDVEEILARGSPYGLAGEEYLYEHVHFNYDGNYLAARLLTSAMAVGMGGDAPSLPKIPSQKECAAALGFTAWNRLALLEQLSQRLIKPPFTFQADHADRVKRIQESMRELRPLVKPATLPGFLKEVQQAVTARPDDWMLWANQASMQENLGQKKEAAVSWNKVLELAPRSLRALCRQGNLLGELGDADAAHALFDRALAIRPELGEAWLGKGILYIQSQDFPAAERSILRALAAQPDSLNALKLLAVVCQKTGRNEEAIARYRKAIELQPAAPHARMGLAALLLEIGRTEEALAELDLTVEHNPGHAEAHYARGLALERLKREDLARKAFEETLRLAPDHAGARAALSAQTRQP